MDFSERAKRLKELEEMERSRSDLFSKWVMAEWKCLQSECTHVLTQDEDGYIPKRVCLVCGKCWVRAKDSATADAQPDPLPDVEIGSRVLFTQASEFPGDEGVVERVPDDEIHFYGIQTIRNGYVEAAREDFISRVGN